MVLCSDPPGMNDFRLKYGKKSVHSPAVVAGPTRNDPDIGIEWPVLQGEYHGNAGAEGYAVGGIPLKLSDKGR